MHNDYSPQCQLMIAQYANGNIEDAASTAEKLHDCFVYHQGCGDIRTYFEPVLYLESFADMLIQGGFRIEQLVYKTSNTSLMWLGFESVIRQAYATKSMWIRDLFENGFDEDLFFGPETDDRNWEIRTDYWGSIANDVHSRVQDYKNWTEEQWTHHFAKSLDLLRAYDMYPRTLDPFYESLQYAFENGDSMVQTLKTLQAQPLYTKMPIA